MQIIGWLALVLIITFGFIVTLLYKRLSNQISKFAKCLNDQTDKIENELCVMMEVALDLNSQLNTLKNEYIELREQQLSLESQNLLNLPHDQAVQMVANGAGVDELIASCGMPRSEAELLVMLNNQKASEKDDLTTE